MTLGFASDQDITALDDTKLTGDVARRCPAQLYPGQHLAAADHRPDYRRQLAVHRDGPLRQGRQGLRRPPVT